MLEEKTEKKITVRGRERKLGEEDIYFINVQGENDAWGHSQRFKRENGGEK